MKINTHNLFIPFLKLELNLLQNMIVNAYYGWVWPRLFYPRVSTWDVRGCWLKLSPAFLNMASLKEKEKILQDEIEKFKDIQKGYLILK